MLKRTLAMITSVLVAASPIGSTVTHAADVNRTLVNINASSTFQTIDNFGASDAWSMDPIGKEWSESNKEKIADLLFSQDKGIGLSSWRFNIGAGSSDTDKSIITIPWRRAESFKKDENSAYDWSKQAGQQWFLKAANDRGVKDLIGFVNSPPVWMTKNGHAQPDASVGSTNLKSGYEGKFAGFLADVMDHFDKSGIHFNYVSPINEPTWDWNGAGQEANRYNNTDIINVINSLYAELQNRNLMTKISAPDGVEILSLLDDAKYAQFMATSQNPNDNKLQYQGGSNKLNVGKYREYIKDLLGNPEIASKISNKIASHSYWSDTVSDQNGDRLGELRKLLWENLQSTLPGSSNWMSEYCILGDVGEMQGNGRDLGIDPALLIARTIHYDLSVANASAWQWWTAVSKGDYKDGLIYTDYGTPGDEQSIYTSKMLWALGNYSKFVRPGAKRVAMTGLAENDPKGLMGSSYLHEGNNKLTSVFVNYTNEDKPVTVQLNQLPEGKIVYHLTPYVTNANESLAQHDMVTADVNGAFQYTIPARSIVTLDGSYAVANQAPEKPSIDSIKSLNKAAEIRINEVSNAESYRIVYGTSPDNMNMTAGPVTGSNYTLHGLENNSIYYMAVIAVNHYGDSAPSDTVSVTPKLSPPQQVWANPTDGGVDIQFSGDPNVPHYLAKWGTASGTYNGTAEIADQVGLYKGTITGLTNGSPYYLAIQAQDGVDNSSLSSEIMVIPTVQPPSKLIAIPGDGKVQLEFPEVQGVTKYSLEMTTENEAPTILELPTNSSTVDHLTNGQSYFFRVSSVGVGGIGQPTANVQATPQAETVTWEDDFQNSTMNSYNSDVSVWNMENGLLKHQSGGDNQGELSIKNVKMIDGTISATAKHSELGADWGIVFRGTDYNHAYSFVFENDALFLRKNGTNLTKPKAFSAKLNQLYQLKIVLDGPHIQAYLDGELIFDVLDSTYSSGMVGLHSWSNAQFSYLKVTRADGLMKAPEIYTVHNGNHRIDLKYAEVDGATAYTVQYGTTSDNLQNTLAVSGGNAAVTGLSNNQVYYFKVVATNGSIQTESSVKSGVPRDIQEPQLLYYVDAGDGSPGTLEDGESFGALNGVEDQAYGVDPVTGNMWGYAADGDATWARTDASGNFETIRQYDGNDLNKGLAYKFNLPNGTYRVTVGFFDPWHDSNRKMDLTINGTTKLTDYVIGNSQEAKQFDSIPVSNGQLEVKVIKKAGPKPMLSWIKVEKDLLYYVDAGDSSPVKLEAGEEFGVRNGVEDQAYQEDPVTGYKWGYDADDSQTWANQNEDRWNSIRQYDGSTNGKGLSYRFEVPNGMYNLDLGFDDPWDSSDRVMDLEVEGQKVLTNYLTGSGQDVKRVVGISVTDGELDVKITKQGNSKPLISWLTVQHDNGIPVQPVIKRVVEGDSKVTLFFDETLNATYDLAYGTDQGSLTHHVSVSGNVNHYTAQNLTNGTPYYFALATVRGDLSSPLSDVKTSTPVGPADPNLYYFVDAGATAVQNGVTLGVKQSVPDQIFGVDPISGKSWGYVADDGKTWAKSDETDPYLSIRQYDGTDNGKGIAYKFEVPHGTYTVQMGFDDPWDSASRLMDIYIQNDRKLQNYVVGDKREIKEFTVDVDTDQLEVKLVKAGSDKPAVGWISVRYVKPLSGSVPITGVSLNKTSASLQVSGTTTLEAAVTPGNATDKTVHFTSSAPSVATVTNEVYNAATGITRVNVTGISGGIATITAKTTDGEFTATSLITVEQPIVSVTGVTLDKTAATLEVGGTVLLKSSITPSNATNKAVRFTSSAPSVATVTNAVYNTETGTTSVTVTGGSSGIATIAATAVDGGITATFTVTVTSSGNGNTPNPTESPDTPKVPEAPVSDIPGKVKIGNPVVETGTAKVTVDAAALNKAFKGSAVALIEVPKTAGVNVYEVNLPTSALTAGDDKKVVVATEIGTVAVPSNMLGASAGVSVVDVALSIGKADTSSLDAETKAAIGSKPVIELNLKVNGSTVAWSNPEAPVLVSIPYTPSAEELANPEHITVWYVDGNGRITAVPTGKYDSTAGKVTFMTTHFSKYAVVYVHKSFRDLADYSWAKNAIEVMASNGVIQGTSDDIFKPGEDITRADFVQLLVRTLGLTAKTDDQFADVSSDTYYAEAIAIALKLGIATGVGGNQFSPDSMITRQDIMVLIERALKEAKKEIAAGSEDNLSGFADRSEVASYAKQSVSTLIRNGIINGDGSGINPLGNATRAETTVLMYRIYNE
ncbi:glycoside hydrolase [Paenibacillus sp. Root444D2]|uniref:glycoside hydrolase n=1 Tax=Paenibacillus sp. Root444D2 TaxID=1736538 RepID=UPI0007C7E946|nr:glycoside hydrolase [Paenibacillus sp. Root444D2]